jgi:hypothetical protein
VLCYWKAQSYSRINVTWRFYRTSRWRLVATPTKGANAIKGIPNTPFILALITTEPVENNTTMKVPMKL